MSATGELKKRESSGSGLFRRSGPLRFSAPSKSFAALVSVRVALLLVGSLAASTGVGLLLFRRQALEDVETHLRVRLALTGAALEQSAGTHLAFARRMAAAPVVVRAARRLRPAPGGDGAGRPASPAAPLEPDGEASLFLGERTPYLPGVVSALFTESGGAIVASTADASAEPAHGRTWWKDAMRTGSSVALSGSDGDIPAGTYAVAAAIQDPAAPERLGVLRLLVSIEGLSRVLDAPADAGGDGTPTRVALFDPSGAALLDAAPGVQPLSADADFAPIAPSSGHGLAPADTGRLLERDGRFYLVQSLPRELFGSFRLAAAVRRRAATAPVLRAALVEGALVAAAVALAIFFLLPLLSRTTTDLGALVEYARRTGSGDATVSPPRVDRPDEIGTLGAALVGSLEGFRSSRAELERAKKTLEERVAARTAELARVNQELKRRAEELAAASRSKDEFLTNVSHELRTPLNSIIGLTQLVRDGLTDSPEETRQFLDQVLLSSRHLLTLINDVLDLAKLEAGKVQLDLSEVDPADVVDDVLKIVEPLALQKKLRLEFAREDVPIVLADRLRLRQVLLNVVQNAVKFTEAGGVDVRLGTSDGRRRVLFEVNDTGIGIDAEKRSQVFEKFIQADSGTTRRFGGTGLGLPISRLLIEAMGGTIGLDVGSGGVGTRVWFTVPVPGTDGR